MSDNNKVQELNQKEKPQKVIKTENKALKFVEDKLNNFINDGNDSPKEIITEPKKIKKDNEEYDFSCSIDEVRTNWRGIEKEDRRKCYVKVLNDRLILDKTGIMIQSDLGSRTIYYSDISSIDFDKSGVFHVTNSVKIIMRGGEFITLIHVNQLKYNLINRKWKKYKENKDNVKNSNLDESQSLADELIKYSELYEKGFISEDEFNTLKQKLINSPTESSNNYCGNCGAEIVDDSNFCTNCGNKIK